MKKLKSVLIAFAALIAIAVIGSLGMRFYYQHQFNRRVAELKAQGYPVSLDDLEKAYTLPEGAPNAADLYIEAFAHYVEPNETERELLPYTGNYELQENHSELPPDVMDAISSFLDKNRQTLELLDKASAVEMCLWPRTRESIWLSCVYLGQIKNSGRLLQLYTLYLAHSGRTADLLNSLNASIVLSETFQIQPFLIDYLIGLALKNLSMESLKEVINRTSLSSATLLALQHQFAMIQDTNGLYNAFTIDRVCSIEFDRLPYKEQGNTGFNPPSAIVKFVNFASGMIKQDMNIFLNCLDGYLNASQLPLHERQTAFNAIESQRDGLSFLHAHLKNSANFAALNDIDLRIIGSLRCAEMACAIERYRLKYDALPETLEALVPEFMNEVPLDPFDGEPLRYIRHDVGYTVYTIGEDGVDNGGLSQKEMRKLAGGKDPERYDWPFTVRR